MSAAAAAAAAVPSCEQTTYVCSPTASTDRPPSTDRPAAASEYYAYRLTRPHLQWVTIRSILTKYSSDWIVALHFPDQQESECEKEHYHMVMRDFDSKRVDAFKKAIAKHFVASGNGLHAGRFRDNHVSRAVGYMKHDERVVFYHSGQTYWDEYINDATPFVKSDERKQRVVKERLGDPVLTYSNVVKQAIKYRNEHMADCYSLQNVLSRMCNQSSWIPSRELLRNGVPRELHELFVARVTKTEREFNWMKPHVPSEDKQRWLDRVDDTPIVVPAPVPGGSNRITASDYSDPSWVFKRLSYK